MFAGLILLVVLSVAFGHFEFEDQHDHHIQYNNRILRDIPDEHLNVSDHRRLAASEYWNILKREVTSQKLDQVIEAARGYSFAKPFPHMTAMDVFPMDVLRAADKEIPDHPETSGKKGCAKGTKGSKSAQCYNSKVEKAKNAFFTESEFGPATKALFKFMQSLAFTAFLEKLSGIEGLIPDGSYRGSGIHQTMPGGFLNVHADFNLDKKNDLHRRVNVFIYMNPDWKDEYGGHLELWSRDLQRCEARVSPDLGKLVVFSSTDFSYHGHQSPLTCPENRSRRSLAMYYYTKTRPASECLDNNCHGDYHTTLFQKTVCPECNTTNKCYAATA